MEVTYLVLDGDVGGVRGERRWWFGMERKRRSKICFFRRVFEIFRSRELRNRDRRDRYDSIDQLLIRDNSFPLLKLNQIKKPKSRLFLSSYPDITIHAWFSTASYTDEGVQSMARRRIEIDRHHRFVAVKLKFLNFWFRSSVVFSIIFWESGQRAVHNWIIE